MEREERRIWRVIHDKEVARRRHLDELKKFIKEISGAKKTPKSLLRLVVYSNGMKISEASDIMGVKRKVIRAWMNLLLKKNLVDVESTNHPNPTIKPTKSVRDKVERYYAKDEKKKEKKKAEAKPAPTQMSADRDIELMVEDMPDLDEPGDIPEAGPPVQDQVIDSGSYVFVGDDFHEVYSIYADISRSGIPSLLLTRINPSHLRREYDIEGSVIWLTKATDDNQELIYGIQDISIKIGSFIEENPNCVFMIDGLEYLIANNSFDLVLKLIQQLRDKVSSSESRMFIPVNPAALVDRQLANIEVECHRVDI